MRVTEISRMDDLLSNIQTSSEKIGNLYDTMATQKQVNVPSDNPPATGTIMRMSAYIETLTQNKEAISTAQSMANMAADTLNICSDLILEASTLASQAQNGSLSPNELTALGNEANELLESLIQYANQSFDGRYLFAGTKTDAPPFDVTRNAEGQISAAVYEGSTTHLKLPVGSGRVLETSVTGNDAFVDTGLIDTLMSLRDNLLNTTSLSEADQRAAIAADCDSLNATQDEFFAMIGQVGARASELDLVIEQADSAILRAKETLSLVQDADIAEVTMELSTEQMIYEALLQASAQIMNISLMNFIG